jgi:hypothetical protein
MHQRPVTPPPTASSDVTVEQFEFIENEESLRRTINDQASQIELLKRQVEKLQPADKTRALKETDATIANTPPRATVEKNTPPRSTSFLPNALHNLFFFGSIYNPASGVKNAVSATTVSSSSAATNPAKTPASIRLSK